MQWLFTGYRSCRALIFPLHCISLLQTENQALGLWLLFMLLFYAGISFPTKGDLIVSFYIHLLAFPKILASQDWGMKVYTSGRGFLCVGKRGSVFRTSSQRENTGRDQLLYQSGRGTGSVPE